MILKFEKINGELCVVIPRELLTALNINEKTKIHVKVDGRNIILEPVDETKGKVSDDPKMQRIFEEVMEKYKETLKKLAD